MLAGKSAVYLSLQLGRRYEQGTQLPASAAGLQSFLSPCPRSSCQRWLRGFFTLPEPEPSRLPTARGSADPAGGSLSIPPAWLELGRSPRDEDFPAGLGVTLGAGLVVPVQLTGFCRNN